MITEYSSIDGRIIFKELKYYDDLCTIPHEEYYYYLKDKYKVFHREDGPAQIYYYADGAISKKIWQIDGMRYRINGPAQIEWHPNGVVKEVEYIPRLTPEYPSDIIYYTNGLIKIEYYFTNDKVDRGDLPAMVEYYINGTLYCETWYKEGVRHRENNPAEIIYYETGKIKEISYYNCRVYHSFNDIPAIESYTKSGEIILQKWYKKGELHRLVGPAVIDVRDNKKVKYYYLHNKKYACKKHKDIVYQKYKQEYDSLLKYKAISIFD